MKQISEKLIYQKELEEKAFSFRYDICIWAEDLPDKQLYIYNGDFKNAIRKLQISYDECGLIYVSNANGGYLQCIEAKCSIDGDKVFLSEKQFNQYWKFMQHSVMNGIRARDQYNKPDDLLNLDLLKRKNKIPEIKNQIIAYRQKQQAQATNLKDPEAEMRRRKRQSAMDNPKLIYCYSAHSNGNKVYHDKTCEDVKLIKDLHFRSTSVPPEGRIACKKCKRAMLIRHACNNHPKQMKYLQVMFQREDIHTNAIQNFLDNGYKFSAINLNELYVFCNEDNWIARNENGLWSLWHNNYERVSETERFISDGYHDQGFTNPRLIPLLRYMGDYTWKGHLEAEQAKKETAERLRQEQIQCISDTTTEAAKEGIVPHILEWIRNLFYKAKEKRI